MFVSCDERFVSWKEYNEDWIIEQKSKLGVDTNGAIPKPSVDPVVGFSSLVKVKYTGWLVDGTCFDYSEGSSFYLSDVVSGWREALSLMPQGSHWRIYVPYSKGYGEIGSKGLRGNFSVPPYSTLIFDIDLIEVKNF